MSWIVCHAQHEMNDELQIFQDLKMLHVSDFKFYMSQDERFVNDRLFYDNNDYLIILDGVLLNKNELFNEYKVETLEELMTKLYEQYHDDFIKMLRGPFTGVIFEKKLNKLIAFCNQTGDAPIFYFNNECNLIISTNFNDIATYLNYNKIQYHFGEQAAIYMLSFGYLIDEHTFIDEVFRLRPGRLLVFEGNCLVERVYHFFINDQFLDITMDEAIEQIDAEFKKAIKRCFTKDLEYGYTHHLVDMSGGLDSRMVNWVARSMGYKNITNISYSQSGSEEQIYAISASAQLGNKLIYKPLDDLTFLFDIEEILIKNFGLASYEGITGGNHLLKSLNMGLFGLEHTGQLGDVVVGSYVATAQHTVVDIRPELELHKVDNRFLNERFGNIYSNQEIFKFCTRGMQGILSSHCTRRNYTEVVSPFIDVDFLSLCFSIPLAYRVNHRLYFAWIQKKYPDALKVPSTRAKLATQFDRSMNLLKLVYHRLMYELKIRLKEVGVIKTFRAPYNSMNPFRYWYTTRPELQCFLNQYYDETMELIGENIKIKQNIQVAFQDTNFHKKLAAITVLGMYKLHFRKEKLDE